MATLADARRHSSPNINPIMSLRREKPRLATQYDMDQLAEIINLANKAKSVTRDNPATFLYTVSEINRASRRIISNHS